MQSKKHRFLIAALAISTLCGPIAASAGVVTFTNRASWDSAVGTVSFTVDFESFITDTSFATVPLNVGPFTLSTVGTAATGRNIVDVAPFILPPVPASFGNAAVDIFVQDPLAADITFATPVVGFFADFLNAGNGQQLSLTLSLEGGGTADLLVPGTGSGEESFGFVSTDAVTAIRLHNSVNDGFYIDNISGTIPEPGTVGLLGMALAFLGFSLASRQRQN